MWDELQSQEISPLNILKPSGDLSIFEAAQFHQDLLRIHQQEGPLVLDLSEVEHVDSSGIQLMVAANRSGRMRITGYSPTLREQFEHIGFAQFLPNLLVCQETGDGNDSDRPLPTD